MFSILESSQVAAGINSTVFNIVAGHPPQLQQVQSVATQTSPKLLSVNSFDSAQSHDQRTNCSQAELADPSHHDVTLGAEPLSFSTQPSLTAGQEPLPVVVERAPPPPPSSSQTPSQLGSKADSAAALQRPIVEWSGIVQPSVSSASPFSSLAGSSGSAQVQPDSPGRWQGHSSVGQTANGPVAAQQIDKNAAVRDWPLQARGQTPFSNAEYKPHAQTGYKSLQQGTEVGGMQFVRSQSHAPDTRSVDQIHPSVQRSISSKRRATMEPASRHDRPPSQSATPRRRSLEYPPSMASSSIDVFEGLGCSVVPYEELEIKRKIGDGSIGQVHFPAPRS